MATYDGPAPDPDPPTLNDAVIAGVQMVPPPADRDTWDQDELDAWLAEQHRALKQGVAARLDLDAGLNEVLRKAGGDR